jgi:phosphoribosylformylglycinamidine cyclo-ligase
VRRVVEHAGLSLADEAPFETDVTLGQALLTPTRIYVRQVLDTICRTHAVKALAHITGGGLTDNIPRVLPSGLAAKIDLSAFTLPPVFAWLQQGAGLGQADMLRTFNCGIGMVLIVGPQDVERVLEHLDGEANIIGALAERGRGDPIRYRGELAWSGS